MRRGAALAGLGLAVALFVVDRPLPLHMAAHALVATVAAPLVVWGAASRLPRIPGVVAWGVFVAAQWALHLPPLFPPRGGLDWLEHALTLATALLFWLPVLGRARLPDATRMLYLFFALPAVDLVSIRFFAAERPELGIAMLAAMLPLAAAAFAVAWEMVRREERELALS